MILIVSELAANAVLHTLSRLGTFTVRVERHGAWVHAEVEDAGGPWIVCEPDDSRPHGLDIVAMVAGSGNWGMDPAGDGHRVVWAHIRI